MKLFQRTRRSEFFVVSAKAAWNSTPILSCHTKMSFKVRPCTGTSFSFNSNMKTKLSLAASLRCRHQEDWHLVPARTTVYEP